MLSKEDIIEEYKEGQKEREMRREINKLREEIRRGTREEENKPKKLKLADVCREIIQENQFDWDIKKVEKNREREKKERREKEESREVKKELDWGLVVTFGCDFW